MGGMAGFVAPAITGVLVDLTGQFSIAFALAAAVSAVGLIGWMFVLPKIAPVKWEVAAA